MKIVKKSPETRSINLRISEETIQKIDKIADENHISRQKLIEAILDQVLEDKNFVLKLK